MNCYSYLVSMKLFSLFGSIAYNPFENLLNFIILFGMWTNNTSSSFKSIVMQNLPVISFILMIFVMEYLLYHTSLMYGLSQLWCDLISPQFVLILNVLSKSRMFDTYLGVQKNVSVEALSNKISSLILTICANEQCNTDHPITGYSFLIDKLLTIVILLSSLFDCTCCWALFIAH